jgi:hypothetical protein
MGDWLSQLHVLFQAGVVATTSLKHVAQTDDTVHYSRGPIADLQVCYFVE